MNIAEKILEYYESEDFKGNYGHCLMEDSHGVIQNIQRVIQESYTFYKADKNRLCPNVVAEVLFDYLLNNIEEHTEDCYTVAYPDNAVDSVMFGEQEEELSFHKKDGGQYSKAYLRKVFDDAGFVVKGDYAYYNLSSGLCVVLSPDDPIFDPAKAADILPGLPEESVKAYMDWLGTGN